MKITRAPEGVRFGDKRFYPPFTVTDECPGCRIEVEGCGAGRYLSYPAIGVPIDVNFWCGMCEDAEEECEWTKQIVINISATEVT
jgi:hypothetical protein